MPDYSHVLVATDFHNDCLPVVKKAISLAKQNDAKLSVVNVIPNVPYYMASGLSSICDIEEQLEDEHRRRLEEAKAQINIEAEYHLLHGVAKVEIIRLAKKIGVDLLVLGSHGRHGVQRFLGSTASGVLHRAKADVLVVRIKER